MHTIRRSRLFDDIDTPVLARRDDPVKPGRPHGHDFIEVAVITRGSALHVSQAGRQHLDRGSVVVVRPGEWHGYDETCDLAVYNVFIGGELFRRELGWIREDPQLRAVLWPRPDSAQGGRVAQLEEAATNRLEALLSAIEAPPAGQAVERTARLAHLLLLLGEIAPAFGAPPKGSGRPTHPAVLRAMQALEQSPEVPWTLQELANDVNLAPSYLARLFTRDIGTPPMAYLARARAELAAALLIETDEPISTISRRIGWPDPNYASRRFRAHFGVSPTRYRSAKS